jgi:two-component system, chemotaxis family, chemotaxis protein CheY
MNNDILQITDMYIILVESSTMQSKLIKQQLQQLGISSIGIAKNGQQALELMCQDMPDLVISSMYLTDMTGTDLVTSMRNNDLLEELPFMLISSETSFQALDPIRQAGVVAILPKPFEAQDLKVALTTSLDFINIPDSSDTTNNFNEIEMDELNVLLVDDSKMARKHIRRVLTNLGIEKIEEAINGKDAIPKIESTFYDLIVTDYNMPEMDGQELTHYIRTQSMQTSTPILMVTSEENENRLAGVHQSGVSGICDKPFEPGEVKAYLRKILL